MNSPVELLVQFARAALERLPEAMRALAPYLHARVQLVVRVELELDGEGGPLPDPVVEVRQGATVSAAGLELDGPPSLSVRANP